MIGASILNLFSFIRYELMLNKMNIELKVLIKLIVVLDVVPIAWICNVQGDVKIVFIKKQWAVEVFGLVDFREAACHRVWLIVDAALSQHE